MNKPITKRFVALTLGVVLMPTVVHADVYLHNPPGSNDRNRESTSSSPNALESFVNWVRGLL